MVKKITKFTTERVDDNCITVLADCVKIGEVYVDAELGYYLATYTCRRNLQRQAIAKFPLRAGFAWLKEMHRKNT